MLDGTSYALIKVQDLGKYFDIANPSDFFRSIAKKEREFKFLEKVRQPTGRPALYIAEPLFYSFILSPTNMNPKVQAVQQWVFGTVMPCIIQDHIYTEGMEKKDATALVE
jgi:prophage antirepressor-like protein